LEDILNFLLTIGSPAFAAYSLQITYLNTRWLFKAFLDIKFPNAETIPMVISAFHHVPIRILSNPTLPQLPSLIVLPQNDGYWNILLRGVKKIRRWSIPLIMNFVWVIVATLLTIVGSLTSVPPGDIGYGTVAIWLFLLPLIIGWLHVGSEPEPNHLRECLETANDAAWVAQTNQDPVLAQDDDRHPGSAIDFAKADEVPYARQDELKTSPIFNYSRAFSWPQNAEILLALVKTAALNAEQKIAVGSSGGRRDSGWVKGEDREMARENRVGNADQVIRYCTEVPLSQEQEPGKPITTIESPQLPELHNEMGVPTPSRWATGVWGRVALATALALGLQWGTTGGAIIIHYWEYPIGLGCRTLSFLLYTALSTTAFFLFLASSILAHMSCPPAGQEHLRRQSPALSHAAIICRWLGKVVAITSAISVLLACFFQAAGAFDTCFCASTTFDRGRVDVFIITNYLAKSTISKYWFGGLGMASSVALLYGFSIYVSTPPRR
jgi:hypothetical protein